MLLDIIKHRYSARTWESKEVPQEKINYILDCALNAPSKQCKYPYTIYVLTESEKSKEFKNWLYWHDTWCVQGVRADPKDVHSDEKRFNGQYRSPLLLLWGHRDLATKDNDYFETYEWQNLMDMTTSASFAMLAAQEQGLSTCFGNCHSYEFTNTILGNEEVKIGLALGIGYAKIDDDTSSMVYPVYKNDSLQGYETRNLSQSYPTEKHDLRSNKPDNDKLVVTI